MIIDGKSCVSLCDVNNTFNQFLFQKYKSMCLNEINYESFFIFSFQFYFIGTVLSEETNIDRFSATHKRFTYNYNGFRVELIRRRRNLFFVQSTLISQ